MLLQGLLALHISDTKAFLFLFPSTFNNNSTFKVFSLAFIFSNLGNLGLLFNSFPVPSPHFFPKTLIIHVRLFDFVSQVNQIKLSFFLPVCFFLCFILDYF